VVGVRNVEFLGFPDGVLEYGLPRRCAIARAVRRHRPTSVITDYFRQTWDGGEINQANSITTGRAILHGVRDAGIAGSSPS
jgi:LmbE family N-acetylglucosaminyl deacetylase